MSRFHSHINTAEAILSRYAGSTPFHLFIKEFFAADKRYGSRDRKSIANNCYAFFRVAHAFPHEAVQQVIQNGLFLSSTAPVDGLDEERNEKISRSDEEKLSLLKIKATDLFPLHEKVSPMLDKEAFCISHLHQPDFFLRVRTGMKARIEEKFREAACSFVWEGEEGIRLGQGLSVKEIIDPDAEAVIQDLSSQEVLNPFLDLIKVSSKAALSVWDCCAGSGGKSILLQDKLRHPIELTVSDSRKNILFNLKKRLQAAKIPLKRSLVADLTRDNPLPGPYDLILCDAPCTGSGTWARTPEQLHFFSESNLESYVYRQEQILANLLPALAPGGLILYVTCSAFAAENENLVQATAQRHSLKILRQEYLAGYQRKADTLFAAALSR